MRRLRPAALSLAALASCLAAPGAHAAVVPEGGGEYIAGPGEVNHVTASFDGSFVTIADSVPVTVEVEATLPGSGECSQPSPNSVRCRAAGGVVIHLEDGDDSFRFAGPAPPPPSSLDLVPLFSVHGGNGNDTLTGSPYRDGLDGSQMRSGLEARAVPGGVDRLVGGAGNDGIDDTDGSANFIDAGRGDDIVQTRPIGANERGRQGRNTVFAGAGNDIILGGLGNDRLDGGRGRDRIDGWSGRDRVRGRSGNDDVDGGAGRDVTDGGPGNDLVQAGEVGCGIAPGAADILIGGSGRDRFDVFCGQPTLLMRDRTRDSVLCRRRVTPRRIVADRKDRLRGRCARRR